MVPKLSLYGGRYEILKQGHEINFYYFPTCLIKFHREAIWTRSLIMFHFEDCRLHLSFTKRLN
jgi:hypothetical protein